MARVGVALIVCALFGSASAQASMECMVMGVANQSADGPCNNTVGIEHAGIETLSAVNGVRRLANLMGFDDDEFDQLEEFDDSLNRMLLDKKANVTTGTTCDTMCMPGFTASAAKLTCMNQVLTPATFMCNLNSCAGGDGVSAFSCGTGATCADVPANGVTCTCGANYNGAMTSNMAATCVPKPCAAPDYSIDNVSSTGACSQGSSILSGGTCTGVCDTGFTKSVATLSCSMGTLTPATFVCNMDCTGTAPTNGAIGNCATLIPGGTCVPTCNSGYTLSSGTAASCSATGGTFSAGTKTCAVSGGATTTLAYQVYTATTAAGTASATISGSMAFQVANAAALAANVTFQAACGSSVAAMAGVPATNVQSTVTAARRLSAEDGRRLTATTITVAYTITVAASASAGIQAVIQGKSLADVKATIEGALSAAGITATVTVTTLPTATVQAGTAAGSPRTHGPVPTTAAAAAVALVMASLWVEKARMA